MTSTATAIRKLAVETDTQLAELDLEYGKLDARVDANITTLRDINGERPTYRGRRRVFTTPASETIAAVTGKLADGKLRPRDVESARKSLVELESLRGRMAANRAAADELDAVWHANGQWSRFFLVPGGHIHSDISTHRCSRTWSTVHAWNAQLSGATEEEAVAELGPLLCTVCFPSAPVEWTVGHAKPERCAGSGKAPAEGTRTKTGMRAYGDCPECGHRGQLNPTTWAVRAHKPPKS